jgi:hypothetical protein
VDDNLNYWLNLVARVANTRISNMEDKYIWGLHQNGVFSIKSMYLALVLDNRVRLDMTIWKLKLPLKIKILTNDNLIKRNWRGWKRCVFCTQEETVQHLFFECHFAKFICTAVHIIFNIQNPASVLHLFTDWASIGGVRNRKLCLTGAAAVIWAIWTSRNDLVFDNSPTKTYMQVLFRGTHC